MPETRIDSASESSINMTDFSVDTENTDGSGDQKETTWTNEEWPQYLGYYKKIPELSSVIDAKATWTVGKGFKADARTKVILRHIRGMGFDTFNTILENMIRTYNIGGDAFCEIMRDEEGDILNIKPLDPGTIKIVVDEKGMIKRYEQISKVKAPNKKFKTQQIFHLARNRVADEIHGQSITEKLVDIILMKNEAMQGNKEVMQRFMKPRYIFHLDTDDPTEIALFKSKMDKAWEDGQNIYVPKDVVVPEMMATAPNATLNPLAWIESLDAKFYEAAQVPKIIVGGTGAITEAAVKIAYLAFQQTIEEEQLFIEEQCLAQLGISIDLEFPASIENELISDKKKDGAQNIQPNETTAGRGQ